VEFDKGLTILARFAHGIEECDKRELTTTRSARQTLEQGNTDEATEVVLRLQAEAIRSVNDAWGVFSPSRIDLLPHQLWVCRKVLSSWPTRWLIADDVGLGKTIEAGIILWPLLARGTVKRLLVLCPASLVEQWQERLRKMFDIRMAIYTADADTKRTDFWGTHNLVVASIHTLRDDNNGRHERLLEAPSWDMLIVDEAHHLNHDEQSGMTLSYELARKLSEASKVTSVLFFTGTPHRGKNFGFLALIQLLRPELFNPRQSPREQYRHLPEVMIRNNKSCATDLQGNRLFQEHVVHTETYSYNKDEREFYSMLTDFIASGKAYASTLSSSDQRAVILVLIAMQKLASSSIAAIRRALEGRVKRLEESRQAYQRVVDKEVRETMSQLSEANEEQDFDAANAKLEDFVKVRLQLMKNEHSKIKELLAASDRVTTETKIERVVEIVSRLPAGEAVLFFTEYKATQAALLSRIVEKFGDGCATFINGDERLDGVLYPDGTTKTLRITREAAAESFNAGKARFLISTEAGGEGIDLQESCNRLIHVDLPWNPMRLHQRVGRLNRYGQKKRVEVTLLHNPETVESLIWEKLNAKIGQIMSAFGAVMETPEDLLQLVLGMTSGSMFDEVFFEAPHVQNESLSNWFDQKTARFGGQDAVEIVRELVGNAQKFDFQQASPLIPRVDLPALKPFFLGCLVRHRKQVKDDSIGLSFKTPDPWAKQVGVLPAYSGLVFDRKRVSKANSSSLLGVGHKVMDTALTEALEVPAVAALISSSILDGAIFIARVEDRLTGQAGQVKRVIIGAEYQRIGSRQPLLLRDWELLERLNAILSEPAFNKGKAATLSPSEREQLLGTSQHALQFLESSIPSLQLLFKMPQIELLGMVAGTEAKP
jgi:ERCC4-related helicase